MFDKLESEIRDCANLSEIQKCVAAAESLRKNSDEKLSSLRFVVNEKILTLGQLHRSLDSIDEYRDDRNSFRSGSRSDYNNICLRTKKILGNVLIFYACLELNAFSIYSKFGVIWAILTLNT